MAISVEGLVDSDFFSVTITLKDYQNGAYNDDGIWIAGDPILSTFQGSIQPVTMREAQNLTLGSERIVDTRKIYPAVNFLIKLSPFMEVSFDDGQGAKNYYIIQTDNRVWAGYNKIFVQAIDS